MTATRQTRRHLASCPPSPAHPDPAAIPSIPFLTSVIRSTTLRLFRPIPVALFSKLLSVVLTPSSPLPAPRPAIPRAPLAPLAVSSRADHQIGFTALFSSFVDDVYRQIARRKRCTILRRNNGVWIRFSRAAQANPATFEAYVIRTIDDPAIYIYMQIDKVSRHS